MSLHEILKERGLSKLQLALKSGVAPSDLYLALNGKQPFYPAWKKRIAEFLQVDEDDLFGNGDAENDD